MTQREVTDRLVRFRFVGRWPTTWLAKESGLSPDTIRRAMGGSMSVKTQTRLEMLFRQIPERCERPMPKRKPGHKKRFLIRYLNLRLWISLIEEVVGKNPNFKLRKRYNMATTEEAGFVCTKLDFMMKWYLLKAFGESLQKRKVFMGDCYSAEKWVQRIAKVIPDQRKDLMIRLQQRKGLEKR